MTNTENMTNNEIAMANPDSDKDKLNYIIHTHFPDSDSNYFYDNCQSGRLLGLSVEEATKVRSCYQAIRDNNLLPLFWQEFKAYRQTVKDRYRTNINGKSRPKRWCRDDVVHSDSQPNVWKWDAITVLIDPAARQIKIVDTTTALYRYNFLLDYSWNPVPTTSPSLSELNRVKKALRNKGVIAMVDKAISEIG